MTTPTPVEELRRIADDLAVTYHRIAQQVAPQDATFIRLLPGRLRAVAVDLEEVSS